LQALLIPLNPPFAKGETEIVSLFFFPLCKRGTEGDLLLYIYSTAITGGILPFSELFFIFAGINAVLLEKT